MQIVVRMSKKQHGLVWVQSIGVAIKKRLEAQWSQLFDDSDGFPVPMSHSDAYRSSDLAIFVLTTDDR